MNPVRRGGNRFVRIIVHGAMVAAALTPLHASASAPPGSSGDESAKAVAARMQRCRLHPGTCVRGKTPRKSIPPDAGRTPDPSDKHSREADTPPHR